MKRLFVLILALAVVGAGYLSGESLSKVERNRLIDHLKKGQLELEGATKGLSPAQWNFKPAPDRWSVAECYERRFSF